MLHFLCFFYVIKKRKNLTSLKREFRSSVFTKLYFERSIQTLIKLCLNLKALFELGNSIPNRPSVVWGKSKVYSSSEVPSIAEKGVALQELPITANVHGNNTNNDGK